FTGTIPAHEHGRRTESWRTGAAILADRLDPVRGPAGGFGADRGGCAVRRRRGAGEGRVSIRGAGRSFAAEHSAAGGAICRVAAFRRRAVRGRPERGPPDVQS